VAVVDRVCVVARLKSFVGIMLDKLIVGLADGRVDGGLLAGAKEGPVGLISTDCFPQAGSIVAMTMQAASTS